MNNSENPTKIYVFDSSSLIALYRMSNDVIPIPERIWVELEKLIKKEVIRSHVTVYNEITFSRRKPENPDKLVKWVTPLKQYFMKENDKQLYHVGQITQKYPKIIDLNNEREQADPWIIAQAIEMKDANTLMPPALPIVVTQENKNKPQKIPFICKAYGIKVVNIAQFFQSNQISLA